MMRHLLSLAEIQFRALEMFRLFDGFCREHGLRYYMCGGTLLGAVRHGGFIPWDDDLDLLMPRPDYERLQKLIAAQPFLPRYEFHSHALGNLWENFTKLVDLNTEVDKETTADVFDRWLWIDVFPMDGLPEDDTETERIYRRVHRARRLMRFLKAKDGTGSTRLRALVKPILKPIVARFRSRESLVAQVDRLATARDFETSRYVGGIVYGYGSQEKMLREDFVSEVSMPFEDLSAVAPGCWDAYLTALYGDYMTLPPEDARQVHFMKIYGW